MQDCVIQLRYHEGNWSPNDQVVTGTYKDLTKRKEFVPIDDVEYQIEQYESYIF